VIAMQASLDVPWQELRTSLRAFVGRRVRNQADVDDLVQRVLLQIVKGHDSLRDAERLHAWVYRTARNVVIDHYRSASVRRETAGGDADDLAATETPDVPAEDEQGALRELAACLTPMLAQLPAAYREALTLTELEGLTQADAAARAGVSLSGMKSRVQRGRRRLKLVLEECCRVDLDSRGGILGYEPHGKKSDTRCGGCD
jgi:RNA polymerase sigma-70 factor, ECF subfamily